MGAPRATAADRIRRVLAIVPWIVANPGTAVADVARRFDLDEADLVADLDVLWMVGIPPYTPDALVEVTIEDGRVWIHYADFFSRPLRLTPDQGLALLATSDALMSVPGTDPDGPLARALAKLQNSLGVAGSESTVVDVDLGSADADVLATLRTAASAGTEVEIDYFSFNRDERTVRVIAPWRVVAQEGAWYVDAFCHQAGAERLFRVDRVESATPTGEVSTKRPTGDSGGTFSASGANRRVTLDLSTDALWVAETYPNEHVEDLPGGGRRVTLAVSADAWLERLLVRLGPRATVVVEASSDGVDALAPEAARRILSRYRG